MTDEERKRLMDTVMGRTGKKQSETQSQTSNDSNENWLTQVNIGIFNFVFVRFPYMAAGLTIPLDLDEINRYANANVVDTLELNEQKAFEAYVQQTSLMCGIEIAENEYSRLSGTFHDLYAFIDEKIKQKRQQYSSVAALVKAIVVENLDVDDAEVTYDANWMNDFGCDSEDMAVFHMIFEAMFNLRIPGEIDEQLNTVGDVIMYLEQNARW